MGFQLHAEVTLVRVVDGYTTVDTTIMGNLPCSRIQPASDQLRRRHLTVPKPSITLASLVRDGYSTWQQPAHWCHAICLDCRRDFGPEGDCDRRETCTMCGDALQYFDATLPSAGIAGVHRPSRDEIDGANP